MTLTSAKEEYSKFPSSNHMDFSLSQFSEPVVNQYFTHFEGLEDIFELDGNELFSFHSSGNEGHPEATAIAQSHLTDFPETSISPKITDDHQELFIAPSCLHLKKNRKSTKIPIQ